MSSCHNILAFDCEENGMISQRILFEVHKTYKQALEEQSKPFFNWLEQVRVVPILQLYAGIFI